jgi:hypothetical protein
LKKETIIKEIDERVINTNKYKNNNIERSSLSFKDNKDKVDIPILMKYNKKSYSLLIIS